MLKLWILKCLVRKVLFQHPTQLIQKNHVIDDGDVSEENGRKEREWSDMQVEPSLKRSSMLRSFMISTQLSLEMPEGEEAVEKFRNIETQNFDETTISPLLFTFNLSPPNHELLSLRSFLNSSIVVQITGQVTKIDDFR